MPRGLGWAAGRTGWNGRCVVTPPVQRVEIRMRAAARLSPALCRGLGGALCPSLLPAPGPVSVPPLLAARLPGGSGTGSQAGSPFGVTPRSVSTCSYRGCRVRAQVTWAPENTRRAAPSHTGPRGTEHRFSLSSAASVCPGRRGGFPGGTRAGATAEAGREGQRGELDKTVQGRPSRSLSPGGLPWGRVRDPARQLLAGRGLGESGSWCAPAAFFVTLK